MKVILLTMLALSSTHLSGAEFLNQEEAIEAHEVEGTTIINRDEFEAQSNQEAIVVDVQPLVNGEEIVTVERNGRTALLVPSSLFDRTVAVTMAESCVSECSASAVAGVLAGALGGAASGAQVGGALGGPQGAAGGVVVGGAIGGVAGGITGWEVCRIGTSCGVPIIPNPGSIDLERPPMMLKAD